MADYSRLHARTLRKMRKRGARAVFTSLANSLYNPVTDRFGSGPGPRVEGYAVEVPGDLTEYAELGLIQSEPVTLMFAPTTYGETPALGTVVTWAGKGRTLRAIRPIRPAGVLVAARLVLT